MTTTAYQALYRKYRPQTFEDVRGRDAIVQTLKNQIKYDRISHSYLFCGTRGTGKTTLAKIFAKAVNCEHPVDGSPCGSCEMCRAIGEDASLNVVEMDAASNNGVEDIRGIIDEVSYSPTVGKKRVYIIDEVHMLSPQAFNALLKTLEEPPEYAIFILATTEPNRLPVTILSRCQRYDFGRISTEDILGRLMEVAQAEGLTAEPMALRYIASTADGSMRDALSLLDQCNAFNYGEAVLTYDRTLEILGAVDSSVFSEIYRCICRQDVSGALARIDEILGRGREVMQLVTDLLKYLRDLMLVMASPDTLKTMDLTEEHKKRLNEDAGLGELSQVIRLIRLFSELTDKIRYSANRRILMESTLVLACRPAMLYDQASMDERMRVLEEHLVESEGVLKDLKRRVENGAVIVGGAGAAGGFPSDGAAHGMNGASAPGMPGTGSGADTASANGGSFGQGAGQSAAPARPVILPEAVPEELRELAGQWRQILAALPMNYMKAHLKQAELKVSPEGELVICLRNALSVDDFREGSVNRQSLESFLEQRLGKRISMRFELLDNPEGFTDNYSDLSQFVHYPIEVEEED